MASQWDILAKGLREIQKQEREYPSEKPHVPKLEDILTAAPVMGKTPENLNQVRDRVIILKENYRERKNSFLNSLERGDLRVEEAYDLQKRIGDLNEALFEIEMVLDKINHRSQLLDAREKTIAWEERYTRLQERLEKGEITQAEFDTLVGL